MGSWVGFTDRLRRHGRAQDRTTLGYCDVAANRIEDLEDKVHTATLALTEIANSVRLTQGEWANAPLMRYQSILRLVSSGAADALRRMK